MQLVCWHNWDQTQKKTIYNILHEYKIHNCEVLIREDITIDQFIDVIEGNRKYIKCVYVYNKIDTITIEKVDQLARQKNSIVLSLSLNLGIDNLLATMWKELGLVRLYTKKKGFPPSFDAPVILTEGRGGVTVEQAVLQVHKDLLTNLKYVLVWGTSAKFSPQRCGVKHELHDEDVLQIVAKTAEEQRHDKSYSDKVQAYYDSYHSKKKEKTTT